MSERFRTTVAGGFKLLPDSTQLQDHVTAALTNSRRGERAWLRRGDMPYYSIEFRLDRAADTVALTSRVIRGRHSQIIHESEAADWPTWMTTVHRMVDRMTQSQEEQPCH